MKNKIFNNILVMVWAATICAFANENGEKQAVTKVVEEAYVQGVHANPSGEAMRKGFHQDFIMFVFDAGKINKVTRDEWISRIEAGKAKTSNSAKPEIKSEFPLVEITGNAAVVKVELHRNGKHIFSDYLSLYKFDDGWKIVGKIFYRHPTS
jgi:hypothetical protein